MPIDWVQLTVCTRRFANWGAVFSPIGVGALFFQLLITAIRGATAENTSVELTLYLPFYYVLLAAAFLAGAVIANRREVAQVARLGRSVVADNRVLRWSQQNVIPPLMGTLAVLLAIAAIAEAYFRITTPFVEVKWPVKFDPRIGFLFEANAELRYTNHLDFWISERINSLGFVDRELDADMLRRGCHVAFIGDSMVEAVQVRNDEKVQSLLEKKAAGAHPEWQLTASAFGYSGTGQLNQLTFYDSFVHHLRPKLVVLVFAKNDFANNSAVLEALRNGWHPEHPPWLFARRDTRSGAYLWVPIDPDWRRYLLKTEKRTSSNEPTQRLHSFMKERSLFYGWLWRKLSPLYPEVVSRLEGVPTQPELVAMRVEALRGIDGYRRQFGEWDNSFNLDLDAVFYDDELPELFSDAVNLTGFALSEFQRRVEQDGGHLVILTTSHMSLPRISRRRGGKEDPSISRRQFLRLEAVARSIGIPVIDQYSYILQNGGSLLAAQFKHDAHWTPQGHAWASEPVLKYLEQNPQICRPQ